MRKDVRITAVTAASATQLWPHFQPTIQSARYLGDPLGTPTSTVKDGSELVCTHFAKAQLNPTGTETSVTGVAQEARDIVSRSSQNDHQPARSVSLQGQRAGRFAKEQQLLEGTATKRVPLPALYPAPMPQAPAPPALSPNITERANITATKPSSVGCLSLRNG